MKNLLLIFLFPFLFISCSDDNTDEDPIAIDGLWIAEEKGQNEYGEIKYVLQFGENNIFSYFIIIPTSGDNRVVLHNGEYSINNNKLHLHFFFPYHDFLVDCDLRYKNGVLKFLNVEKSEDIDVLKTSYIRYSEE